MPFIAPEDGYLTVFNMFETDTVDTQERVLDAMRDIIDNANYPGWISSTLHAGSDEPGTGNYIQWRSLADLEARYAGDKFKNRTVPLFFQLASSVRLLKTEVEFAQHHPARPAIEISPDRDDYTVMIIMGVEPDDQKEVLTTLAQPEPWLFDVPGYRSHTYFRGLDGTFIVNYAQWDDKATYDRFHTLPEQQRPVGVRQARAKARSLVTSRWANTYRVVHSRSAETTA